jgi:RNA polymerase sigma factor (sigma-70 family)
VDTSDIQVNIDEEAVDCSYENKIDFDEFNRLLQIAKQKLPPRQAQIFELNKEQALSVQEIAQSLQITEQVVRNQLSVALRLLRNEMKKFAYLFAVFF